VWDGLDDVDLEQSITYNVLDNEHRHMSVVRRLLQMR